MLPEDDTFDYYKDDEIPEMVPSAKVRAFGGPPDTSAQDIENMLDYYGVAQRTVLHLPNAGKIPGRQISIAELQALISRRFFFSPSVLFSSAAEGFLLIFRNMLVALEALVLANHGHVVTASGEPFMLRLLMIP